MMEQLEQPVHFIAIGGAGMSPLARILLARGMTVRGSDAQDSLTLRGLEDLGARVFVGQDAGNLGDARTVVVSSAIKPGNPELDEARRRGLRELHRSDLLALLVNGSRAIAVAGTHGKTSTSSMAAVALRGAGLEPAFAIGAQVADLADAPQGNGGWFVAEADESDGSFLKYVPEIAVVTNIEPDHLDHYGDAESFFAAFRSFRDQVLAAGGALVVCGDDPGCREVFGLDSDTIPDRVVTYGFGEGNQVRLTDFAAHGTGTRFTLQVGAVPTAGLASLHARLVELSVPGEHNALNAAAALAATALALGDFPVSADVMGALRGFRGAARRFDFRGEAAGVRVYDDYAHHPTEVEAALTGARPATEGKLRVVFQPHLYSRTRIFAAEFARALALADDVVVVDVYGAREEPEPGVDGNTIASLLPGARHVPDVEDAVREVALRCGPGDLVLTMGAGDITDAGPWLLRHLERR